MPKTIEENFIDWESHVFGFGYGTGEEYILPALKIFFENCTRDNNGYDYQELEHALSPPVAWLLINTLCGADIIDYGTSPRYGWLTKEGAALKSFVTRKTAEELYDLIFSKSSDYIHCAPTYCNCEGVKCLNPFWKSE